MSSIEDRQCKNEDCRCSAHPENCCTPESIAQHKANMKMVERRERAKRQGGQTGTSAMGVGS